MILNFKVNLYKRENGTLRFIDTYQFIDPVCYKDLASNTYTKREIDNAKRFVSRKLKQWYGTRLVGYWRAVPEHEHRYQRDCAPEPRNKGVEYVVEMRQADDNEHYEQQANEIRKEESAEDNQTDGM